jgi:uncharacterized coiled-coil DUF342 family protein
MDAVEALKEKVLSLGERLAQMQQANLGLQAQVGELRAERDDLRHQVGDLEKKAVNLHTSRSTGLEDADADALKRRIDVLIREIDERIKRLKG